MKTRIATTFGLALIMFLGVLGTMVVLGQLNPKSVLAEHTAGTVHVVTAGTITANASPNDPGAVAKGTITFSNPNDLTANLDSIVIEFEDDVSVPTVISPADVTIAASRLIGIVGTSTVTGTVVANPLGVNVRMVAATAGNLENEPEVTLEIPDMEPSTSTPGAQGIAKSFVDAIRTSSETGPTKVTVTFRQTAGIKNPSESKAGHQAHDVVTTGDTPGTGAFDSKGYSVKVGVIADGTVYAGSATNSESRKAKIPRKLLVNDESGARGDDVTLTGKGFQNGTTATIWLDVDADGTRDTAEITLGSALVGSDDSFSVTLIVSNPPFNPGSGTYSDGTTTAPSTTSATTATRNTWNAIDGQLNTLHCRSADFICPNFALSDDISVTPTTASIGDTVQIKATDFGSEVTLSSVTIGGISVTGLPSVTMTTQGDATFNITIPNGIPAGSQELKVTIGAGNAPATMVISGADLTLTPDTNLVPNQTITVIGRGFSLGGSAKIAGSSTDTSSVLIDGSATGLKASGAAATNKINEGNAITVDNGGNWSASIVLPINNTTVTAGSHEFKITDDGGREGVGTLMIAPRTVVLTPAESRVGTVVTVTGTGFPGDNTKTGAASTPSVSIRYTVSGTAQTVATLTPAASGNITGTFTVPLNTAIPSTNSVTAEFDYTPSNVSTAITSTTGVTHRVPRATVTIDPTEGPTGTTVTIVGEGFKTYSTVSALKIGDVDVRPAPVPSTDSDGSFRATILVPQLNTGSQSVTATVSATVATDTFTVLTVAPTATPAPVVASMAPADALAALISNNDNLQRVWHFDPSKQSVAPDFGWFLYDPRPVFAAANSVDEIDGGKFYWINVREAQTAVLGGVSRSLFAGWNPITW